MLDEDIKIEKKQEIRYRKQEIWSFLEQIINKKGLKGKISYKDFQKKQNECPKNIPKHLLPDFRMLNATAKIEDIFITEDSDIAPRVQDDTPSYPVDNTSTVDPCINATECFPTFEPTSSPRGMLSDNQVTFRPDSYPVDRQNATRNSVEIGDSTDDKAQLLPPNLYTTS